ncbi:FusB/FusC family EF-G-binding protein [Paenibacillus sp. JX-17]|uniref:FusB/FusC family EF-G-binding protein n=1 Tax=Paenibacillus lacisoli TaxID=3064525 RepID=A0ABT9CA59_9BACL|nr:FusB/FusC family EF-G-binding protein [Paenibacillus sp. JX-17]MDO7906140.1 FusB/FusC family EF-G-binding protein [Paenibacillus sp. JX-17]
MSTPFIKNNQYNVIKKQSKHLLHTLRTVADRRVLETVRHDCTMKIVEAFSSLTPEQQQRLESISLLETADDFSSYLSELEAYLEPYPTITPKQIEKLFPKSKKLKVPDLQSIDFRFITYLGWMDISTNRLFVVYPFEGQFVGLEGRLTPTHKKGYCLFCNRHHELAFFLVKTKPAVASPDNVAAVGQYICMDNQTCNQSITNTEALEKFIRSVRNER